VPKLASHQVVFEKLYGRRDELAALAALLNDAVQYDRGHSVLVSGDAGVGKTRVVGEIRTKAAQMGWNVLLGTAVDYVTAPFGPLMEALGSDGQITAAVSSALGQPKQDAEVDVESDRLRRFKEIEAYLRRRAVAGSALLLVIEDIHWSDRSTLDVLAHLAQHLRDVPVVIVSTYRETELEGDPSLATQILRLRRAGATELPLPPLSRADIRTAIADTVRNGAVVVADEVEAILDLAEGRPFVAEELLRDAVFRARAEKPRHGIVISLRASVLARVADFTARDRDVLLCAAAIGREFDVAVVASVIGLPPTEISRVIRQAKAAQLIIDEPRNARVSFRHAITREVLYQELLGSEARDLHLRIAGTLEGLDPEAHLSEISNHFWAARSPEAVRWNERAGHRAITLSAHGEASRFFEHALDLAPRDDPAYTRLLELAATSLCIAGEVDRARLRCEEAVSALRRRGEVDLALDRLLHVGYYYYETGNVESALSTMERVRQELADLPMGPLRYVADVSYAAFLALQAREREALSILDAADALDVLKAPRQQSRSQIARGLAYNAAGDYAACLVAYNRAYEIGSQAGEIEMATFALSNAASVETFLGDVRGSIERFTRAVDLARAHGHLRILAAVEADLAVALLQAGQLSDAREMLERLLVSRQLSTIGRLTATAADLRLRSLIEELGIPPLGEVIAAIDGALAYGEPQIVSQVGAGAVNALLALRDAAQASAQISRVMEHLSTPEYALEACRLAALTGSDADANAAERILTLAVAKGSNRSGAATLLLCDAYKATKAGANEESRAAALRAAVLYRELPWPIEEAEALEVAGDVEAALAVYRRIGATRAARRLEDALGVRRSAETRGDGGLSRREEQVAELLCQGLPYKDIADRLGIGERTIETHAKAVYRKLGVKDRRELMTRRRPRAS